MWRAPLSTVLSAIFGSAVATVIYALWLSISEIGIISVTAADLRIAIVVFLAALWFTLPGAIFLWAAAHALSVRVQSHSRLDAIVVFLGALAGCAMLGGLAVISTPRDFVIEFALLGGFYGFVTALAFVLLQRQLGVRRLRRS